MLYEHEVYRVLSFVGVEVPDFVFVRDPAEVDEKLLSRFSSSALMLKTVSRDMAHNQRYGGVKKAVGRDPLFIRFLLHSMRKPRNFRAPAVLSTSRRRYIFAPRPPLARRGDK